MRVGRRGGLTLGKVPMTSHKLIMTVPDNLYDYLRQRAEQAQRPIENLSADLATTLIEIADLHTPDDVAPALTLLRQEMGDVLAREIR